MVVITATALFSMLLAKILTSQSLRLSFNGKRINLKRVYLIYFIPILLLFVLRWNVPPMSDTTYNVGGYSKFFSIAKSGSVQRFGLLKEPLSWGMIALLAKLGLPWIVALGALGVVFVISYAIYIDKTCISPAQGIFIFLTTGTILFGMSALRQVMSVSFVLYAYYVFFTTEKINAVGWIKIVGSLLIGGLFHMTSIFMIPVFMLSEININRKTVLLLLALFALLRSAFGTLLLYLLRLTRFSGRLSISSYDENFAITYVLLGALFVGLIYVFYGDFSRDFPKARQAFNFSAIFLVVMLLSGYLLDAYRIMHCFTPFLIIVVPVLLSSIKKRFGRAVVSSVVFLILIVLYFRVSEHGLEFHTWLPLFPDVLTYK